MHHASKGRRPRSRLTSVAEILPGLLQRLSLPGDIAEKGTVLASWDRAAGNASAHSKALRFRGSTLVVEVSSPAWMNELSMRKTEILARIAEISGPGLVTDLRFTIKKP